MNKKLISQLLLHGKLTVSEKVWLKSIKFLYKSLIKNPKKLINKALVNITPLIKVKQLKQKRKRSRIKEFPFIVTNKNRVGLALKSIINKTGKKTYIKTHKKLTNELLSGANNSGNIITSKKNLYEYAFVKKKYFYYRWF